MKEVCQLRDVEGAGIPKRLSVLQEIQISFRDLDFIHRYLPTLGSDETEHFTESFNTVGALLSKLQPSHALTAQTGRAITTSTHV
jgi:hypothetical protein